MTDYRLDPNNPPQLTPEEARRLDEAPIDYSDIPPLFGDDDGDAREIYDLDLEIVRRILAFARAAR